ELHHHAGHRLPLRLLPEVCRDAEELVEALPPARHTEQTRLVLFGGTAREIDHGDRRTALLRRLRPRPVGRRWAAIARRPEHEHEHEHEHVRRAPHWPPDASRRLFTCAGYAPGG